MSAYKRKFIAISFEILMKMISIRETVVEKQCPNGMNRNRGQLFTLVVKFEEKCSFHCSYSLPTNTKHVLFTFVLFSKTHDVFSYIRPFLKSTSSSV